MNRRSTLKLLAKFSVGSMALGHWSVGAAAVKTVMDASQFSSAEQDIITSVADTIIPKGDAPYGALAMGVPIYLLGYFEKCEPQSVHALIKQQLHKLNINAQAKFSKEFVNCSQSQREALLQAMSTSNVEAEKDVFDRLKKQTIHGFRTSQKVMTEHYHYRVATSHYKGNISINDNFVS